MNEIVIRKAEVRDALDMATVQSFSWKNAYSGILPADVLDQKIAGIPDYAEHLRVTIPTTNHLVAEVDSKIVGVSSYSKSRDPNFANVGEIRSIYILPEFQRRGVGKKLFLAGIKGIIELGYDEMMLNALKDNKNAIGFYKEMGGKIVGEKSSIFGSQQVTEVVVKFDNLKNILEDNMER